MAGPWFTVQRISNDPQIETAADAAGPDAQTGGPSDRALTPGEWRLLDTIWISNGNENARARVEMRVELEETADEHVASK